MGKRNTSSMKKLPEATARLLKRNTGLCGRISTAGKFSDHTFVSKVVNGHKAPSQRFLKALTEVLIQESDVMMGAAAGIELAGFLADVRDRQRA